MPVNRSAVAAGIALVLLGMTSPALAQGTDSEPVAARDLPRGAVLVADDIAAPDAAAAANLVGWVTRRVFNEGDALREPGIAAPQIIRSGDPVQLVWREGPMEIRIRGKAMGSAAEGETILVRVDTQRRFEGIAYAPGEVRLAPPESN